MLLDVFNWAFWIGVLLWIAACVSTVWVWGGSKRNALGQLTAGMLMLISGTLFIHVAVIHVAVINVYAQMDNAYLGNGFLGLPLIISGMILLIGSLAGYGAPIWVAGLLLLGYALFGVFGVYRVALVIPIRDSATLLFAAVLIIGVLLYATIRGYALDVLISALLAWPGVALVWIIYGAGLQAFPPVDTIGIDVVEPPVLGFGPFLACLLIAASLFVATHFIQQWLRGDAPQEQLVSDS